MDKHTKGTKEERAWIRKLKKLVESQPENIGLVTGGAGNVTIYRSGTLNTDGACPQMTMIDDLLWDIDACAM